MIKKIFLVIALSLCLSACTPTKEEVSDKITQIEEKATDNSLGNVKKQEEKESQTTPEEKKVEEPTTSPQEEQTRETSPTEETKEETKTESTTKTSSLSPQTKTTSAKVTGVTDGDTLYVLMNDRKEKVRLIGIDTPESVHRDHEKNTREGIIASKYTRQHLAGQQVELEFDAQERDKYGRLLAYVWVGDTLFNNQLLEEGYAQIATYPPNVRYVDQFKETEKIARENQRGFWSNDFELTPLDRGENYNHGKYNNYRNKR